MPSPLWVLILAGWWEMGVVFEYLSLLSTAPRGWTCPQPNLQSPPGFQAATDRQNATLVFRRHQISGPNTHWTKLDKQTHTHKKRFTYKDRGGGGYAWITTTLIGENIHHGMVRNLFYHDCVGMTACFSHYMLHILLCRELLFAIPDA